MEVQQLESFIEVAKRLNFSKAADKLHITQSTMSARIHKLETDLGVPLFIRQAKGIRLSRFGEVFLPFALQCMEAMDSGVKRIMEVKTELLSKLTISSANPFGSLILPHILPALHDSIPNIRIEVLRHTGFSEEILRMVVESQIDIGFFNDATLLSSTADLNLVNVIPLYEDDVILLARPTHPLSKTQGVAPADLIMQDFVFLGKKTSVAQHILNYFAREGVKLDKTMEINNIAGIKEMLKQMDMLTLLPRLVVADQLKSGELVEIDLTPALPPLVTFLAYQQNYFGPKIIDIIKNKVAATIEELKLSCRVIL